MTTETILQEAVKCSVRIQPGVRNRLALWYDGELDPNLERLILLHKPQLIRLLTEKRNTAKQILQERDAEWGCMDSKTWHLLYAEMAANHLDPLCYRALNRLRAIARAHCRHK